MRPYRRQQPGHVSVAVDQKSEATRNNGTAVCKSVKFPALYTFAKRVIAAELRMMSDECASTPQSARHSGFIGYLNDSIVGHGASMRDGVRACQGTRFRRFKVFVSLPPLMSWQNVEPLGISQRPGGYPIAEARSRPGDGTPAV